MISNGQRKNSFEAGETRAGGNVFEGVGKYRLG